MGEVGVRDLKASLSRYLRRVKGGESLVITERGKPIARIVPVGIPEHIAKLMAEGKIKWTGKNVEVPRERIKVAPGPSIVEYITEDREDRF